jgi:hypothetical protein
LTSTLMRDSKPWRNQCLVVTWTSPSRKVSEAAGANEEGAEEPLGLKKVTSGMSHGPEFALYHVKIIQE